MRQSIFLTKARKIKTICRFALEREHSKQSRGKKKEELREKINTFRSFYNTTSLPHLQTKIRNKDGFEKQKRDEKRVE